MWFRKNKFISMVEKGNIQTVIEALDMPDLKNRCDAILALGVADDEKTIDILTSLLNDGDISIRISASKSLGKIGLAKSLGKIGLAKSLGRKGSAKIVDALLKCITNKSLVNFIFVDTQKSVLSSGKREKRKGVVGGEGNYVKLIKEVALALQNVGEPAVKPLTKELNNQSARMRGVAVNVLMKIGDKKIAPSINHAKRSEKEFELKAFMAFAYDKLSGTKKLNELFDSVKGQPFKEDYAKDLIKSMTKNYYGTLESIEHDCVTVRSMTGCVSKYSK